MTIKTTRFKVTIDEESGTFLTTFITERGIKGDLEQMRHITLFTWAQLKATVELAHLGKLETDAEVKERRAAGRNELLTYETVEDYLKRGGVITRFEAKFKPPADDDSEAWDKLLNEIVDEVEMENPVGYTAGAANLDVKAS